MEAFDPREHLITIKNRQSSSEYLPVQYRLVWFRQECPDGMVETEIVHLDLEAETSEEVYVWNGEKGYSEKIVKTAKGLAVVRAIIKDGRGGIATGVKMEKAASFADFLEKAETGSIGRALAALGYGTQFAPELDEERRSVDTPADGHQVSIRSSATSKSNGTSSAAASTGKSSQPPPSANTNRPLPTVKALRARAKQLFPSYSWEAVLEKILGTVKPDDNLVTEELLKIERNLDGVEARRANGAA